MYGQDPLTKPMSFGDWIVTMLLLIIPVVNIVLLFIWAFGSKTNINKRNYARANLLFMAIALVLGIIIMILVFASGGFYQPGLY
jgi:heme/copper-type cytochrome/quinol oxidase subunit 2